MTALDHLARTDTVSIATTTRDGREVVTPIWAVVVDGVPYIRNGYGEGSFWYRRARRSGRVAFVDGAHRYDATLELIDDEKTKTLVDEAYRAKYRGQGSAVREVASSPARDYTLRVALAN